jgi:RNA polymerase sigma factor (sigma-70 family)
MKQLLDFLRVRFAAPLEATDRNLLDQFLETRDESAFAELVRRHGPIVWDACRRWLNNHDAEDVFQATFLVLLRRATSLPEDLTLGPWLYQVAVMTARNMFRGNRRRAAFSEQLNHDVPESSTAPSLERLDLDLALLTLPERDRAAVVLCYLQGLSRREAAARLGCPVRTFSARLSRALDRLRARLGRVPHVLVTVAGTIVPYELSAATVRTGVIYMTSNLAAAGLSPAVERLTQGVLRMMWLKKLTTGPALVILAAVALVLAGVSAAAGFAKLDRSQLPDQNQPLTTQTPYLVSMESDEPAAPAKKETTPAGKKRIVEGRILDEKGIPPRSGKIYFNGTKDPHLNYNDDRSWSATLDTQGRYRIELSDYKVVYTSLMNGLNEGAEPIPETVRATGPLNYMVIAPGFQGVWGKASAGEKPLTLDVQLKNEKWIETELRLVDLDGKAINDAEVILGLGGSSIALETYHSDSEGRCRITRPGGCNVTISRKGYLM